METVKTNKQTKNHLFIDMFPTAVTITDGLADKVQPFKCGVRHKSGSFLPCSLSERRLTTKNLSVISKKEEK